MKTSTLLTDSSGSVVWSAQYAPFGDAIIDEDPDGDGFGVMFNLRLPGQYYDAESGLHYNWHRYYDPETGRYITADPTGLAGGINQYAYVEGNPINWFDSMGLKVQRCSRPAQIAGGLVKHHWIKTDTKEAGMGPALGNGIPGNQSDSPYITLVAITDHTGESNAPEAVCEEVPDANEDIVNKLLKIGKPLGRWSPINQCQSFTSSVLYQANTRPIHFPELDAL